MEALVVVENVARWPMDIPGTRVVSAREYLTDPALVDLRRALVFNFCRSYSYQSLGYYVSLLALARGHRPLPSVSTIQALRLSPRIRIVADDLQELVQRSFSKLRSDRFTLSVYFGRNLARRYDRLGQALFNHFPAPFLRADFVRSDAWRLQGLRAIATSEIPDSHREFVISQARRFLGRPTSPRSRPPRYELAILVDPEAPDAPSDERAIRRFVRAARRLGMRATPIGREEFGRIAEYDGLFIRETTRVDHHTFRFASRAAAEGMVVIDDPESIVRCSNKVYQAELFQRRGIPSPRTIVVHRDNVEDAGLALGYPCVLKRPDGCFSRGVAKAEGPAELLGTVREFFSESDLIVAQEYVPSPFDWRVGVLDGQPLYVCRYHMSGKHWQIARTDGSGTPRFGRVETLAVEEAPPRVVRLGVRAARLIGDGLYGVDLKSVGRRLLVMEVNDNPSIEAGYEDAVLGEELYLAIMRHFYDRLEVRGRPAGTGGR